MNKDTESIFTSVFSFPKQDITKYPNWAKRQDVPNYAQAFIHFCKLWPHWRPATCPFPVSSRVLHNWEILDDQ